MRLFNHLKSTLSCTAIALLLTACGGSSTSEEAQIIDTTPVVTIDYQKIIDETVSDVIPGIILLVESPDKKFLGSAGVENTENKNPMQTYHTMPTASAGKPMIALLAVMLAVMLADENLLNLDDTLDTWLSDDILNKIENSREITLRQLLNHTSGIFNHEHNSGYFDLLIGEPEKTKTDIDFLPLALNQPAYSKPGEGFTYSNTGYVLAGLIMDKVLEMHHSIALRERILEPLGMNATYYRGIEKSQGDFISGYYLYEGDNKVYDTKEFLINVSETNSPIVSSVEDMALFMKSVVADQGFINEDIRENFLGSQQLIPVDTIRSYGLGIIVESIRENTVYSHGGLTYGYHTQNIYIKEKDLSITAFINCSSQPVCENTMESLIKEVRTNELK